MDIGDNGQGGKGEKPPIDIGADLLQRFQCLATQDKDVLIREFQRFLPPNQLSSEGCAFFLDMNNWNLQQAICAYYDYDAPKDYGINALPSMSFVSDVTIGEGEEVPPNTRFIKTWRIQNVGPERWPVGCVLRFVAGDQMTTCERIIVDPLEPGQCTDVSVEMISPSKPGIFQGQWRISTATGQYFGDVIWVIITVAEGGLLGLTQQMDSFHSLGSPVKTHNESLNPFASKSNQVPNFANQSGICNELKFNLDPLGILHTRLGNDCETATSAQLSQDNHLLLSSGDTKSANMVNVNEMNGDSSDNHLPPTPPLSEDMTMS